MKPAAQVLQQNARQQGRWLDATLVEVLCKECQGPLQSQVVTGLVKLGSLVATESVTSLRVHPGLGCGTTPPDLLHDLRRDQWVFGSEVIEHGAAGLLVEPVNVGPSVVGNCGISAGPASRQIGNGTTPAVAYGAHPGPGWQQATQRIY